MVYIAARFRSPEHRSLLSRALTHAQDSTAPAVEPRVIGLSVIAPPEYYLRRRAEISTAIESVIRQRQVQEVASKLAHSDRCAPPGAWYAACAQQEDWPFTESQHVIKLSLYCSHYPWFFSANGFSALRVLVAAVTHEQPAVAYLPTSTPPPRSPPSP